MLMQPAISHFAQTVCPDAALISRCIHSSARSRKLLRWLSDPNAAQSRILCRNLALPDTCAPELIGQLWRSDVKPRNLQDASASEENRGLAGVMFYLTSAGNYLRLDNGPTWMRFVLLPLLRATSEGTWKEAAKLARLGCAEWLCVNLLCWEIGKELVDLLNSDERATASPHSILRQEFGLSVEGIARGALEFVWEYEEDEERLRPAAQARLTSIPASELQQEVAPPGSWFHPDILWRIASDIQELNERFVLPRSWADTDVRWDEVAQRLEAIEKEMERIVQTDESQTVGRELLGEQAPRVPIRAGENQPVDTGGMLGRADQAPIQLAGRQRQPKLERPGFETGSQALRMAPVLIAEIHDHNDPVLLNSLGKLLSACNAHGCSLTLAIVTLRGDEAILPGGGKAFPCGTDCWQQLLLQRLYDHPGCIAPRAFWTSSHQLIAVLPDCDRQAVARNIRTHLDRIVNPEHSAAGYKTVEARYHGGISQASPPFASGAASRVIEAAYRCLLAATRQPGSTVRGIDVL